MPDRGYVENRLIRPKAIERRLYQETLLGTAAGANTLIVAPTALGKTVISVLLATLKLIADPETSVVVMAPTRPLVQQHVESFRAMTTLEDDQIVALSGLTAPDARARLWKQGRVVCATPQTVQNDILAGRVPLRTIALMVFDECHRAVGDYSYVFISERYRQLGAAPHILALTASPGNDRETIDEVCVNLAIEKVEIRTERDGDVEPYVNPIAVEWRRVDLPDSFIKVRTYLDAVIKRRLLWLKGQGLLRTADPREVRRKDLIALQARIRKRFGEDADQSVYRAASYIAAGLKLLHAVELLESQGMHPLERYLHRLEGQAATVKGVRILLEEPEMRNAIVITRHLVEAGIEHPKLKELITILKEELDSGGRIIVFTQYRDSVSSVVEALKAAGIESERFVGQAGETGLTQKNQLATLNRFRDGAFPVLVATSVAEEGLDIPEVGLVLFYEPVPSAVRTIQRRGRTGRKRAGRMIGLITRGTRDEGIYWASVHRERRMREELTVTRAAGADLPEHDRAQSTLDRFDRASQEQPSVVIYVDTRESSASLVRALTKDPEVEVRTKQLVVADFLVSEKVAVERKRTADFLQSLIDGRLLSQARRLAEAYPIPLIVLEGGDLYGQRNLHPNAIRGMIASLTVDFGIGIIPTRDEADTAAFLLTLAKREQLDHPRRVAVKGKRRVDTLAEQQELVLCSFPHINVTLAKRLLEHFGTVAAALSASEDELREVHGIGERLAKEITSVSGTRYEARKRQ